MKTIELSRCTGASVHTIRYYERIGLLKAARNRANGYHQFTAEHADLLVFIRRSRAVGLSLPEIRVFLQASAAGHSSCSKVVEIVRRVLPAVEREIAELVKVHARMKTFMRSSQRRPRRTPAGADVRRLVASLTT